MTEHIFILGAILYIIYMCVNIYKSIKKEK